MAKVGYLPRWIRRPKRGVSKEDRASEYRALLTNTGLRICPRCNELQSQHELVCLYCSQSFVAPQRWCNVTTWVLLMVAMGVLGAMLLRL